MSNYDIAVIGAGVIGTSVAYHLTKAGMKVVLIEKGDLASGTSSRCDSVGNLVQQVGHDYLRTCNVVHHVQLPVPCFSRQQAGTAY